MQAATSKKPTVSGSNPEKQETLLTLSILTLAAILCSYLICKNFYHCNSDILLLLQRLQRDCFPCCASRVSYTSLIRISTIAQLSIWQSRAFIRFIIGLTTELGIHWGELSAVSTHGSFDWLLVGILNDSQWECAVCGRVIGWVVAMLVLCVRVRCDWLVVCIWNLSQSESLIFWIIYGYWLTRKKQSWVKN